MDERSRQDSATLQRNSREEGEGPTQVKVSRKDDFETSEGGECYSLHRTGLKQRRSSSFVYRSFSPEPPSLPTNGLSLDPFYLKFQSEWRYSLFDSYLDELTQKQLVW